MTLGQRIQELRKSFGLSQEELGEKMGVSRQAISKWEGDQAIPELDKLIPLSKLFGLTVGQLLGVEQPVPAPPAAPLKPSGRAKALLAGMGAALLILAVLVGMLWSQVLSLERQTALNEEYVSCYHRELFQTAECRLSDIELGFPWYEGDQDLTLDFTLRPVKQFKGWSVLGYTAIIQSRAPIWWLNGGQPEDDAPPPRTEYLTADPKTGKASLTLPGYQGESVTVQATLREKGTGRELTTDTVFTVTPEIAFPSLILTAIQAESNPAPDAVIPKSIALALPNPQFES
ncbi:helix-turn-helix domain-containing protein [Flintibacter muris]|uniref:helix-turn-helix domain-containing protein n=1 Tax=Flintibacter muris TaxID=2941327 RepID=UPI00203C86C1|nr:helix-turn-helix transcriptional regulator [Flintibacter muris]